MRAGEFIIENASDDGKDVAEAKRKKKSSRSMGGYFFPGYGYYGSGDSGEGGGDGGGESVNRGVEEGSLDERSTSQAQFRTMAAAAHNPKFAKKVGIIDIASRKLISTIPVGKSPHGIFFHPSAAWE